jgi:hypothetical protein
MSRHISSPKSILSPHPVRSARNDAAQRLGKVCGTIAVVFALAGFDSDPPLRPTAISDNPNANTMTTEEYVAVQTANPHATASVDPSLELALGLQYQQVGRLDLAEPYYRKAMTDGKSVRPAFAAVEGSGSQTVAEIACKRLEIGYGAGFCESQKDRATDVRSADNPPGPQGK